MLDMGERFMIHVHCTQLKEELGATERNQIVVYVFWIWLCKLYNFFRAYRLPNSKTMIFFKKGVELTYRETAAFFVKFGQSWLILLAGEKNVWAERAAAFGMEMLIA